MELSKWYKKKPTDKIWWLDNTDERIGAIIFSFDKHRQYNLFADCPHNLTPNERKVFAKECPYWAGFLGLAIDGTIVKGLDKLKVVKNGR